MSHQWLNTVVANYRLTDLLGTGGMGGAGAMGLIWARAWQANNKKPATQAARVKAADM